MLLAQHYQEHDKETKAQEICKRGFAAYRASEKLNVREEYDQSWPNSLYEFLTSETAYDSQGAESLCHDMMTVYTSYDEESVNNRHKWAQRLYATLGRSGGLHHKQSQAEVAHSMLKYLAEADRAHNYQVGFSCSVVHIDSWGSAALDLLASERRYVLSKI